MAIYKIWHTYSKDIEAQARYIETDLSQKEAADIIIGLQLHTEEYTRCGESCCINEDMAQYLMCNFFGCKPADKAAWTQYIRSTGGKRTRETKELCSIDLYLERERRCGERFKQLLAPIEAIKETDFMKAVRAFFDDEKCFTTRFSFGDI